MKCIFKIEMKSVTTLLILVIVAASVMNMKASVAGEAIDLPLSVASLNSDDENIGDLNVLGARRRLYNRYRYPSRYQSSYNPQPIINHVSYQQPYHPQPIHHGHHGGVNIPHHHQHHHHHGR